MHLRYYKLMKLLKEKHVSLEGMRIELKLLPSTISKIRTNRALDHINMLLICRYLHCEIEDIMDFLPEDNILLYDPKILEKHSYMPKKHIKKEFKSPLFTQ